MRIGSLFSGIGGLELGLERAGLGHVAWQVRKQLASRTEAIQTSLATTRELRERAEKAEREIERLRAAKPRPCTNDDCVDGIHISDNGMRARCHVCGGKGHICTTRDPNRACHAEKAERERADAIDAMNDEREVLAATERQLQETVERAEKAERERDEARAERDARPDISAEDCDATVLVCALTENATLWPDGHKAADRIVNALRAHAAKAVKP